MGVIFTDEKNIRPLSNGSRPYQTFPPSLSNAFTRTNRVVRLPKRICLMTRQQIWPGSTTKRRGRTAAVRSTIRGNVHHGRARHTHTTRRTIRAPAR